MCPSPTHLYSSSRRGTDNGQSHHGTASAAWTHRTHLWHNGMDFDIWNMEWSRTDLIGTDAGPRRWHPTEFLVFLTILLCGFIVYDPSLNVLLLPVYTCCLSAFFKSRNASSLSFSLEVSFF